MNSKSIWFIVIYVSFWTFSSEQKLQKNEALTASNLWLSESSLGTLFFASEIRQSEGGAQVILKNQKGYDNPAKMWRSWQYLEQQYQRYGLKLADEVFSGLARVLVNASDKFEVRLICQDASVYSIRIYLENGEVRVEEDLGFARNVGATPYEELRVVTFSNLQACLVLNLGKQEIYSRLIKVLEHHYENQKTVDRYYKFDPVKEQDGSMTITVSGLKALVTTKFHERVELRFSGATVVKDKTNLCFELSGEYSSGIYQPGEFEDLKKGFIPELVDYQEQLKDLIKKSME